MATATADLEQQTGLSRSDQRKRRLLEIEREAQLEEQEGLKFTTEQRHTLWMSFQGVKVEFYPLDGLNWFASPPRSEPSSSPGHHRRVYTPSPSCNVHSPAPPALAVLTNSNLDSEDLSTVRVTRHFSSPTRPRSPVKGVFGTKEQVNQHHDNNSTGPTPSDGLPHFSLEPLRTPSLPRFRPLDKTESSSSPPKSPPVQPIIVSADKNLVDDDDLKTPVAPRRTSSEWMLRNVVNAGGVKRKR